AGAPQPVAHLGPPSPDPPLPLAPQALHEAPLLRAWIRHDRTPRSGTHEPRLVVPRHARRRGLPRLTRLSRVSFRIQPAYRTAAGPASRVPGRPRPCVRRPRAVADPT